MHTPVDAVAIYDQIGEENDGQIASMEGRDGYRWRRKELRQWRKPTAVLWHWQRMRLIEAAVDRSGLLHVRVFAGLEVNIKINIKTNF